MIANNWYPVSFADFLKLKRVGNYTIMYAILKDRLHLEMAIENAVFATQKFLLSIEEELKIQGENYAGDALDYFFQKYIAENIAYRYFPTDEQAIELYEVKLYAKLIVEEINHDLDLGHENIIKETDDELFTYNLTDELIMKAKKVLK